MDINVHYFYADNVCSSGGYLIALYQGVSQQYVQPSFGRPISKLDGRKKA